MNIEIEIPVAELKSALPGLSKIISRSTSLPVLRCLKVSLDAEQKFISLQAHNLNEIATARLPNNANNLSGELLVPLEPLSKIVKGCSANQSVRFIATKEETKIRYTVAGSSVNRVLTHIPTAEWPQVKVIPSEPIPLDDAFKDALREALESASVDSSRYVLNGACLDSRYKEGHYVVGTDGHHLYCANSFRFNLPEPLIIPTAKFLTWTGFVNDGPWKLRMLPAVKVDPKDKRADKSKEAPPWLQIDSEHWSYVARAVDGQYPDWKQVLPIVGSKWTKVLLEGSASDDMLSAIALLPGAETLNRPIVLEIAGNGLALKGQGPEQKDWIRVVVPGARVAGKPVQVAMNRDYLLQALRLGLREISIDDSLAPLVFSSPAKTMIVMPLRLEGPPAAVAKSATAPQPISQQENTAAAPPSAAGVDKPTEQTNNMSTTTMTAPERDELRANGDNSNKAQVQNGETRSAFKSAVDHVERIRGKLREVISDLNDALALLKNAEKENKTNAREVEAIRAKLREIQSVEI